MSNAHKIAITFFTVFLLSVTLRTNAQNLNLTGDWRIDTARSNYGNAAKVSIPFELKISQTADTLSIARITKDQAGQLYAYTERLPINGHPQESMIHTTKKSAFIALSQNMLIETAAYRDDHFNKTYKGVERWSISDNGVSLTIDRMEEGDVQNVYKLVYKKQ